MRRHTNFVLLLTLLMALITGVPPASAAPNAISGRVFLDNNADGQQNTSATPANEPGIVSVTVNAYAADGALAGSDTTDNSGDYTITGLTAGAQYSLEFILPAQLSYLQPGPALDGTLNTSVIFAAENDENVNMGFTYPVQFCQNNPFLATPCFVNGDPLDTDEPPADSAYDQPVLVSFPFDQRGTPANNYLADAGSSDISLNGGIGATWGLAYQRSTGSLWAAAVQKRHVGYGPQGPGAIYRIPIDLATGLPLLPIEDQAYDFIDLEALGIDTDSGETLHEFPANGGAFNQPNQDLAGFDAVGKRSIGDIDVSDDDRYLWVVNLTDRTLYKIDLTTETVAASRLISLPGGVPACPAGDVRPWAVTEHQGEVYVGAVCSAESTQDRDDLHAYILATDLNLSAPFSNVTDFSLDFPRGAITQQTSLDPDFVMRGDWLPWVSQPHLLGNEVNANRFDLVFGKSHVYPQPILSDIEFDEAGAMILGFIDRNGHQTGNANLSGGLEDDDPGTPWNEEMVFVDVDVSNTPNNGTAVVDGNNVVQPATTQPSAALTSFVTSNDGPIDPCNGTTAGGFAACLFEGVSGGISSSYATPAHFLHPLIPWRVLLAVPTTPTIRGQTVVNSTMKTIMAAFTRRLPWAA